MNDRPDQSIPYTITDTGRAALDEALQRRATRYKIDKGRDGWTYLYCTQCTTGHTDYLGAWPGPASRHTESIAAVRQEHEDIHLDQE